MHTLYDCRQSIVDEYSNDDGTIEEGHKWNALLMSIYWNYPKTVKVLLKHGAGNFINA